MVTQDNSKKTKKLFNIKSIYDPNIDINLKVVTTLAVASSIANSIGFLANFFLYGINFPTAFCGACAVFCWFNLLYGTRSKRYMLYGTIMLTILSILEFPLLIFTYGPVMHPYLILGYMGVLMLTKDKKRVRLCTCLIIYDTLVIVFSTLHPYVFGPQDPTGLMGSAIITFLVTITAFSVCIIIWQTVYVRQSSDIDPVTGVLSSEGFTREFTKRLRFADKGQYAVIFFNVVSFKAVNAVYGITGGNLVLKQLGERLKNSSMLRPLLTCRQTADRFYVLVEEKNINYDGLPIICNFKYFSKNMNISLQLNCGIYKIDDPTMSVQDICDRASAVLNLSSEIRSRHYDIFSPAMEAKFLEENEVLSMIESAVDEKAFEPYYQPIVDCQTGRIVSAEALARWIRKDGSMVPPNVFIPVLEKKELISELDQTIATKVNRFMESRAIQNKKTIPVSINLSRVDLYNEKLMSSLQSMVEESNLGRHSYRFELTESTYESIPEGISKLISKIRNLGAMILIDDFGSGYSSLGTITDCEFDVVKLDMSFAQKLNNQKTRGVVKSLIELCHNLGAKVTAEGIEDAEQLQYLRECGCDYIQGYYFYKPMSESEFEKLLDNN